MNNLPPNIEVTKHFVRAFYFYSTGNPIFYVEKNKAIKLVVEESNKRN